MCCAARANCSRGPDERIQDTSSPDPRRTMGNVRCTLKSRAHSSRRTLTPLDMPGGRTPSSTRIGRRCARRMQSKGIARAPHESNRRIIGDSVKRAHRIGRSPPDDWSTAPNHERAGMGTRGMDTMREADRCEAGAHIDCETDNRNQFTHHAAGTSGLENETLCGTRRGTNAQPAWTRHASCRRYENAE